MKYCLISFSLIFIFVNCSAYGQRASATTSASGVLELERINCSDVFSADYATFLLIIENDTQTAISNIVFNSSVEFRSYNSLFFERTFGASYGPNNASYWHIINLLPGEKVTRRVHISMPNLQIDGCGVLRFPLFSSITDPRYIDLEDIALDNPPGNFTDDEDNEVVKILDDVNHQVFNFDAVNIQPNPFYSSTLINYQLDNLETIGIYIYDIFGRKITTIFEGKQIPGIHKVAWDDPTAASGIYHCVIRTNTSQRTYPIVKMN